MALHEVQLRDVPEGAGAICRRILGELPTWFGIPEAVEGYVALADTTPTVVAEVGGQDVGLLSLTAHGTHAAEIALMAVRPAWHRRGIGRRLVEHAETMLSCRGVEYLQVKTLSELRADDGYAATRAFYAACGFRPLEELPTLWGTENPAVQLVKRLEARQSGIHHVELWVSDLGRAIESWGFLLSALGYQWYQDWQGRRSWTRDGHYVVLEQSPDLSSSVHDRCRPGLNHIAFHAGARSDVEGLAADAANHGWRVLFADRHPHAGGPDHFAAFLENIDGYEVELVASPQAGEDTPTAGG